MKTIFVTGAVGFIGSAFCRYVLENKLAKVIGVDKMTYAASPRTLADLKKFNQFKFYQADICDAQVVEIMLTTQPDALVHFAAETHVDRSIDRPGSFMQANIIGTFVLLEGVRAYLGGLRKNTQPDFRFHHISTDEVFGSLGAGEEAFTEASAYRPNSPYSATKAASDHMLRAWHKTYNVPMVISHCSNNYGPYQFPEKLIPTMITKALRGDKLPIYGTGDNIRDWLYVDDHAEGLWAVLSRGRNGESYNLGGGTELTNLQLVKTLCQTLDERLPNVVHRPHESLIDFVQDRPGHDKRYAIDFSKITNELGWKPRTTFKDGLAKTVDWYLANKPWWEEILANRYAGERLGNPAHALEKTLLN